jgi:restriction system protein
MIPDYQSLMLPLLRFADDGKEHRIGDVVEPLAKQLRLTESEATEMLPSGKQTVFSNRVHWAKTYLAQAKLLEITRRAHFRLTDRGREVLRENPAKVDVELLERFSEFNEFRERRRDAKDEASSGVKTIVIPKLITVLATPDETLRATVLTSTPPSPANCLLAFLPHRLHSLKI